MAVATKGQASDAAAIAFLAAFVPHCSSAQLPRVVLRDPSFDASLPTLSTRLISLCAAEPEAALLAHCTAVLRGLVHGLPDLARDILLGLLSSVTGAENQAQANTVARVLLECLRPPCATLEAPVAPGAGLFVLQPRSTVLTVWSIPARMPCSVMCCCTAQRCAQSLSLHATT